MNPPYVHCWFKLDISKSDHHVISELKKVTAHELYYQFEPSADFFKNEVLWLIIERSSSLVWHCLCAIFHKIDCLLGLNQFLAIEY